MPIGIVGMFVVPSFEREKSNQQSMPSPSIVKQIAWLGSNTWGSFNFISSVSTLKQRRMGEQ